MLQERSITFFLIPSNKTNLECCKITTLKIRGKAVPLQAWTGPEGSRRLRFPDFKTIGTLRYRPPLTPGSIPGTQFC